MAEVYTREQIESGMGFFSSGEWTCVWRVGPGQYITTAKEERPRNPGAELVAGGCLHVGGRPHGGTLRTLRWV